MANIHVTLTEGLVQLTFEAPDREPTILSMPPEVASQIGAALLGCSEVDLPGSLFDHAQMMSLHNPRIEVRRSDAGQTIIAFLPNKMRPIMVQLDQEKASRFIDELSSV